MLSEPGEHPRPQPASARSIPERSTRLARGTSTARIGVLLSGTGRTFQYLHEACRRGVLPARLVVVVSSRPDAAGLAHARSAGASTVVCYRRRLGEQAFQDAVTAAVDEAGVDLVCLAGFRTLWRFPPSYQGRVLNIHPALLPKYGGPGFYGLHVHRAVLEAGESVSGCTVHLCDHEYDHGPIILQRSVPVQPGDTAETLAARVFTAEREAYPEAIGRVLADLSRPSTAPPRHKAPIPE